MSGASAATRSTTSRQNSSGISASKPAFDIGVLGPRRDPAAGARLRVPEAFDVLLGEDHRGIEADDREAPGDVEDRPDDDLANIGPEEVELGRVVPRESSCRHCRGRRSAVRRSRRRAARRRRRRRCRPNSGPRSGSRSAGRRPGSALEPVGREGRLVDSR